MMITGHKSVNLIFGEVGPNLVVKSAKFTNFTALLRHYDVIFMSETRNIS